MNGASSDSKVFVKLYGEKGDTNKMILAVSDNDLRNYFETGRTDIFTIDTFDIGQVSSSDMYTLRRKKHLFVLNLMFSVFTDKSPSDWSH